MFSAPKARTERFYRNLPIGRSGAAMSGRPEAGPVASIAISRSVGPGAAMSGRRKAGLAALFGQERLGVAAGDVLATPGSWQRQRACRVRYSGTCPRRGFAAGCRGRQASVLLQPAGRSVQRAGGIVQAAGRSVQAAGCRPQPGACSAHAAVRSPERAAAGRSPQSAGRSPQPTVGSPQAQAGACSPQPAAAACRPQPAGAGSAGQSVQRTA